MSNTKYFLDTNIISNAVKHCSLEIRGEEDKDWGWKLKRDFNFIKNNAKNIKILDLVWCEFLGIYLQKEVDFLDYSSWYKGRFEAMAKIFGILQNKGGDPMIKINDHTDYLKLFSTTLALTQAKLNDGLIECFAGNKNEIIEKLSKTIENATDENKKKKLQDDLDRHLKSHSHKIFDGIDGIITVYAALYANKHQDEEVFIITDDNPLRIAINYYQKNELSIGELNFPKNLKAKSSVKKNKSWKKQGNRKKNSSFSKKQG